MRNRYTFGAQYLRGPFYGWGYQDFTAGTITGTSVTLSTNENCTIVSDFETTKVIGSTAVITQATDEGANVYTGTTKLFSSKVAVSSHSGASVTLSGVPHSSWGDVRIWYYYEYTWGMPAGYSIPSRAASGTFQAELQSLFITEEEIGDASKDAVFNTIEDTPIGGTTPSSGSFTSLSTDTFSLSGLIANRLLATDVNCDLISTDLSSWLSGTTNQITIANDGDGTATISLPSAISVGTLTLTGNTIDTSSGTLDFSADALTNILGAEIGSLNLSSNQITTDGGTLSFGTENLSTSGTLACGNAEIGGYLEVPNIIGDTALGRLEVRPVGGATNPYLVIESPSSDVIRIDSGTSSDDFYIQNSALWADLYLRCGHHIYIDAGTTNPAGNVSISAQNSINLTAADSINLTATAQDINLTAGDDIKIYADDRLFFRAKGNDGHYLGLYSNTTAGTTTLTIDADTACAIASGTGTLGFAGNNLNLIGDIDCTGLTATSNAGDQLNLYYDATHWAKFDTDASGGLTIYNNGGDISFDDENLSTDGTLDCGAITSTGAITDGAASSFTTGTTVGTLTLANGSITDSSGSISFGDEELTTNNVLNCTGFYGYGDPDTYIGLAVANNISLYAGGLQMIKALQSKSTAVTINPDNNNVDFIIDGDTNNNVLIADAGVENITVNAAAVSANYDLMLAGDGVLGLKETSTPTADTNYGKVYCKNDDKLYFQDGAGNEHEIAFA